MTSDSPDLPSEATASCPTLDVLAAPTAPSSDHDVYEKCSAVEAPFNVNKDKGSDSSSILGDPITQLSVSSSSQSGSSSSSYDSYAIAGETAETAQPAPAAAAEHASSTAVHAQAKNPSVVELLTADKASEVQLMATLVLQRKQQQQQQSTPAAKLTPQDPLHLLNNPDKGLKARKELLLSAFSGRCSADGGSARVAAVKEELAGVQARLRDAWGLRESSACGQSVHDKTDYHPPLHKRSSCDYISPSCSQDGTSGSGGNKVHRLVHSNAAAAANGNILGPKAAALQISKPAKQHAAAVAPTGAAARARAAGGHMGVPETAAPMMYYDTSSEVAAMAAQVLQRRAHSAGLS